MMLLPHGRVAPVWIDAEGAQHDRGRIAAASRAVPGLAEVVIACEDRLHFVHAILGAWSSGAVAILPANLSPATLADHGASAIVIGDGEASAHDVGELEIHPSRTLVRLTTSGSSGVPKILDKTAGQLFDEVEVLQRTFDLRGTRVLCTVPLHHIYGLLFGLLVPLVADATVIGEAPLHPEAVLAAIRRFDVDVLVSTPAQLRAFEVLPEQALATLRYVFSSGAPLPRDTAAMLRDRLGAAPTEIFGSSETGGIATRTHAVDDPPWLPLAGVTVSADASGRLLLRSPWLAPGAAQPWPTDDRVAITDAGFVHLGRTDDVVKVGGKRVALGDVTAKALAIAGVDDAHAWAVPTADARGTMIALAVATAVRTPDEVRAALRGWFDGAVIPRRIVCVPSLPRTAAGKLPLDRIAALLGAPDEAPTLRLVEHGSQRAVFDVDINPDLQCFVGHFPGDPILPGAYLLEAVVQRAIEAVWPELGAATSIPRAKFTERIGPGDALRVALERRGQRVVFTVVRGDVPCAAGSFGFAAEPLG